MPTAVLVSCLLFFLAVISSPASSSSSIASADEAVAAPVKPNIILIIGDDIGYGDVGAYGQTAVRTPHLNDLAAQGIRTTAAYTVQSVCAPSRAGLMTGRYPQRFGFYDNYETSGKTGPDIGLPPDEQTIAEVVRPGGYATGAIGKWHLGDHSTHYPTLHGFDYYFGFAKGCCRKYVHPTGITRNGVSVPGSSIPYTTIAFGNEAVGFIRDHAAQPFFLYIAFNAAHTELQALPQYLALYPNLSGKRRDFAAVVTAMDDQIGRITKAADALARPTIIIFGSDNGAKEVIGGGDNGPWRGGKHNLLEGGIRVPFIWRAPGYLPAGKIVSVPVSHMDVLPTIASLAGAALPPKPLDGVNIWPLLAGSAPPPHHTLYWKRAGSDAIRDGVWKLVRSPTASTLYNLSKGKERLTTGNPAKVAELEAMLFDWESELAPPKW